MPEPARDRDGTIIFPDHPEFRPNQTIREMFSKGVFAGGYWRKIHSGVTNRDYENVHRKYPKEWWVGIPESHIAGPSEQYDKTINKYGVKAGTSLDYWQKMRWIVAPDVYGWVQWYAEFTLGRRGPDDERQINRWQQIVGPNGRFRKRLINLIRKSGKKFDDYSVSPKIRQLALQWAYELTEKDFNED